MSQSQPPNDQEPAVVLLSGGLDSATTLAMARDEGFACHALSFDYGQRHRIELDAARRIAKAIGVASHRWATIDPSVFRPADHESDGTHETGTGSGHRSTSACALVDSTIGVPKDRDEAAMSHDIPVTYVPARNTVFLAYAVALAEVLEARDIFMGVNAVDYSGYPDCRPAFIEAFERTANLATRAGVEGHALRIRTPLIDWTKTRIIERGLELGVDYAMTHSCYDPKADGQPCTRCDACLLRQRAFEALGGRDPVLDRM